MSTGNERIWYGRPVIDLEAYVGLILAVQRLESQMAFANDDLAILRHKIREMDRAETAARVSRETEEDEPNGDPTLF